VHGGVKVYRGAAGAARMYVEADRSRADDYYLAEGTGIAQRFTATGDGHVVEVASMDGDAYEGWVAGLDPDTGQPRGRLRTDGHAVRFVELTVNGPKSWSLASELHPDVATAYEAAQDRAAGQIIGWLAEHARTRVGPRGGQVAVAVEGLEAAVVRHYTSRAGDPHRHLHLQVNARVFAVGRWRGIDTVGVRDSIAAINGIGHAAVVCDPQFRAVLAAHGYTLDTAGEIAQLAPFVGPFSRRATQIERHIARYEAEWTAAHPGEQPGRALRRSWDARAWAEQRPDKVRPQPGSDLHGRWLDELARLGYRDRDQPISSAPTLAGQLDRDQAVIELLARLGAARSGWNAADIRGEAEQLIAREGIVADAAVRGELAEDLTARTLARCVSLLARTGVPDHVRALTSQHVLDVEADLAGRLAVRGAELGTDTDPAVVARVAEDAGRRLDNCQARAVALLGGRGALVVVEGAAGAGKTTTLAATRDLLTEQRHRLIVVTPTLKAAKAANAEVGAQAGSAAWLVHQHGWRWEDTGTWTRLRIGDLDPVTGRRYTGPGERARLRAGDLLVVDEAGMLDQDTARAVLAVADEHAARVAFLGDRHQLSAVGRGGVLDLATRWADPRACMTLNVVHRFTRQTAIPRGGTATVPDTDYAQLTVSMRTGEQPEAVFDALQGRGQIRLYASEAERQAAIAETVAAQHTPGHSVAVVVDTGEQVNELNAAIRDRLVATGTVNDTWVVTTLAGQRIGAGDQVATRRNDRDLDVANRDTWTVTHTHGDAGLTVTSRTAGERVLSAGYVEAHVELAYATTAHGAQGATATTAHLVLGEHTGAASAYVGMTRGRQANTAHLIAATLDEAREQWVTAFTRDRTDLGPGHARQAAERAAAGYAKTRPVSELLDALRQGWDSEARDVDVLADTLPRRDNLRQIAQLRLQQPGEIEPVEARYEQARETRSLARALAEHSETAIAAETEQNRDALLAEWNAQRPAAQANARKVLDGPGRLGLKLPAVNRANEALARWSVSWQPIIPSMPTGHAEIARFADRADDTPRIHATVTDYARRQAEARHPEHERHAAEAVAADHGVQQAWLELRDTQSRHHNQLDYFGRIGHTATPEQDLAEIEQQIATAQQRLSETRERITQLEHSLATVRADPIGCDAGRAEDSRAWLGRPADPVHAARIDWAADRVTKQQAAQHETAHRIAAAMPSPEQQRGEAWRRHVTVPARAGHGHAIER